MSRHPDEIPAATYASCSTNGVSVAQRGKMLDRRFLTFLDEEGNEPSIASIHIAGPTTLRLEVGLRSLQAFMP